MAIDLEFSPISSASPGGERDLAIDFVDALEASETISSETVTSHDSLITISGVSSAGTVTTFHVATSDVVGDQHDVIITVAIVGDSGTETVYECLLPVVYKL